jgi:hypothetical protein
VALVRTDVSEELIEFIIGVKNQRASNNVRSNQQLKHAAKKSNVPSRLITVTLMTEAIRSSETSDLTIATWDDIPEDWLFINCLILAILVLKLRFKPYKPLISILFAVKATVHTSVN